MWTVMAARQKVVRWMPVKAVKPKTTWIGVCDAGFRLRSSRRVAVRTPKKTVPYLIEALKRHCNVPVECKESKSPLKTEQF
jgi:hypothetical protein